MLNLNDIAPDFILPCDNSSNISINDYNGKNIVLYFYPKDDTPGCTQEAKDFRDRYLEFIKLNTVIIGVSRDTIDKHDEFRKKYDLPFNLVSDEDATAANEYGVWVEKNMYGKKYMGVERATYLIDKSGRIKGIWRKVRVNGHVDEVIEAIRLIEDK